ncbi:MAG TPA: diguanylate cyclase [Candidatus Limnocylindria bacterium]|nr:diguanylate cyclase [Candidatus Limnocylindria bacterium]
MTVPNGTRADIDLLVRTAEQLLVAASDEQKLLALATDLLGDPYGYGARYVLLHDDQHGELYTAAFAGPLTEVVSAGGFRARDDAGVSGACFTSGRVVNVPDVLADDRYIPVLPSCRSEICVPIAAAGRALGVLGIESDQVAAFSPADEQLLVAYARLLAMGLMHARQHQGRQKDIAELQAVSEVAQRAAALDLSATLDSVCGSLRQLTTSDSVAVYLWDARSERLRMAALSFNADVYGADYERNLAAMPLRLGEGLVGWTALHREPVRIDDVGADPRPGAVHGTPPHSKSAIAIPLLVEDRLVGVARAVKLGVRSYTDDHFRFARTLASQAALAIAAAEAHEEIRRLSVTDELTGAYNSRHVMQRLREEVESARRHDDHVSLLVVDGDCMKQVNDRYGHAEGNRLLVRLTETMRASLRTADVLARFGGDEFVVVLPRTGAKDALAAAERLRISVAGQRYRTLSGETIDATVSVGIASYPEDGRTADDLFRAGDRGLYAAKESGRNRVAHRS